MQGLLTLLTFLSPFITTQKEFLKTRLSECSRIIVEWRKIVAPNQHLFLKSVAYKQHSIIFASDNFVVAAMKVKSRMISV